MASSLCLAQNGIISTIAGGGKANPGDGGPALNVQLQANTVYVDGAGNIYAVENRRIRKIDTNGIITTIAGTPNGGASNADGIPAVGSNIFPTAVAVDSTGLVYFTEVVTQAVRTINKDGTLGTYVGSATANTKPVVKTLLDSPSDITFDNIGNLYIANNGSSVVHKVTPAGAISVVAGNGSRTISGDGGSATSAGLAQVRSVAVDNAGNLYILNDSGTGNTYNRVRKVDRNGIITTVAGGAGFGYSGDGGPAVNAALYGASGLACDPDGNLYIADHFSYRIRKVDHTTGIITTIAGDGAIRFFGDGGPALSASFNLPNDIAIDTAGDLYVADPNAFRIRKITFPHAPRIFTDGVVNGASLVAPIVPNSWATIKGSSLAPLTDTWDKAVIDGKLPASLDGVTVTIDGIPAYLYYISSNQINFIVPDVGFGTRQVVVKNSAGTSAAYAVTSSQYGPAFFPWPANQAVATRQDFTWAVKDGTFAGVSTRAAKPGEVIILWGTGFGPTTPAAPFGVQTPADQTYSTSTLPQVIINNLPVTVYGAALAPGNAGLYQVAIQVPESLADGDYPVRATIGGVQSPDGIVLAVRK
jgi:uncharacterized protein (TIGR03437 family)